ncbi:hypothetical protein H6783_01785 [Candidatus Nomurabacteria bacterium]|nr:hypothetical protein [Candidatus Nomurabacteria bacterium]
MQHGEKGAYAPRNIANQHGKAICDQHNAGHERRYPKGGGSLFQVAEANMATVTVETRQRRSFIKK